MNMQGTARMIYNKSLALIAYLLRLSRFIAIDIIVILDIVTIATIPGG
jgi:hypothetical protein